MSGALLFVLSVLAFAIISIMVVFKTPSKAAKYFKTVDGQDVLKGIVIFVLAGVAIVGASWVSGSKASEGEGKWFAYGDVYLGLDYTRGQSPQCLPGPDSKATSNGGIRLNIYQSGDNRFEANAKYTHHSCAFAPDRNLYDAIGFELNYRFYSR